MAKGKNQKISKKGKAARKNEKHPFTRKEWFKIVSPPGLETTNIVGFTPINKTQGTKKAEVEIKGRVAEITHADLTTDHKDLKKLLEKKIKILIEETANDRCLTSFYEFELAKEKIYSLLKKRQTVFELFCDVKTKDGQILRVFVIAITTRAKNQLKVNSYIKASLVKVLRKKMIEKLTELAKNLNSTEFATKVLKEEVNAELQKHTEKLKRNMIVMVKKVKVLKKGKVDTKKLIEESKVKEVVAKALDKNVPADEKNQLEA